MKTFKFLILFLFSLNISNAQNETSPYEWKWKRDGIWTATALAGNALGFYFIVNKDGLTESELQTVVAGRDNINAIDRWAAGKSSQTASDISDIPFYLSFAAPLALFFEDAVNDNGGQIFGLFLESMATTGALYTLTAGLVDKSRPYVYDENESLRRRLNASGQRSFFSGHTSVTATATFFVAKVYQDFNPNSPGIPYIWAGAIALPAAVGALRIEAGQHFLTDVMLGYAIGASIGYFVPELHKKKNKSLSLTPVNGFDYFGESYQGLSLKYRF
jgi:membrane-associated phospholipid phosphatase